MKTAIIIILIFLAGYFSKYEIRSKKPKRKENKMKTEQFETILEERHG